MALICRNVDALGVGRAMIWSTSSSTSVGVGGGEARSAQLGPDRGEEVGERLVRRRAGSATPAMTSPETWMWAGAGGPRPGEDEAAHEGRMAQRQLLGDHAAHRQADHDGRARTSWPAARRRRRRPSWRSTHGVGRAPGVAAAPVVDAHDVEALLRGGATNADGHMRPDAVQPFSRSTVGPAPPSCQNAAARRRARVTGRQTSAVGRPLALGAVAARCVVTPVNWRTSHPTRSRATPPPTRASMTRRRWRRRTAPSGPAARRGPSACLVTASVTGRPVPVMTFRPASRLSTLPVGFRGSSSRKVTRRGHLVAGEVGADVLAHVLDGRARGPGARTTKAASAWPNSSSGTPITATSATAGWWLRSSSTSAGYTFSPPDTIMSSSRPSM